LVVEDSAVARQLLTAILEDAGGFEVIDAVVDGERAVRRVADLRPDLVTMDLHLHGMDGLQATARIMRETPTPIAIVSASGNLNDQIVFEALRAGALTAVERPLPPGHPRYLARRRRLLNELRAAARARLSAIEPAPVAGLGRASTAGAAPVTPAIERRVDLIAIAASTGGPVALSRLLSSLPRAGMPPIVVVQHIADGFVRGLASWLTGATQHTVRLAVDGESLTRDVTLLAPDERHLEVTADGRVALVPGSPVKRHRPSANRLLETVAATYGKHAAGIVLTGMGQDGAEGLLALRRAGGLTIAQDRASSIVYGMPAAAVALAAAERTLPLDSIGPFLRDLIAKRPSEMSSRG
jgi:two-component system chemotaxis response regulator CheB